MGEIREYDSYDATGLAELVRRKQVSAGELLETALSRAERLNPKLNALVHPAHDRAKAAIAGGLPDGPFTGVPFLLKDLGCEAIGYPTNAGSRFFADLRWSYDSEIWIRLRRTGSRRRPAASRARRASHRRCEP